MTQSEKRARINIEVTPLVLQQVDWIKKVTDTVSMSEVVRRAIRIHHAMLEHQEAGGAIVIRRPDGTEIELFLV